MVLWVWVQCEYRTSYRMRLHTKACEGCETGGLCIFAVVCMNSNSARMSRLAFKTVEFCGPGTVNIQASNYLPPVLQRTAAGTKTGCCYRYGSGSFYWKKSNIILWFCKNCGFVHVHFFYKINLEISSTLRYKRTNICCEKLFPLVRNDLRKMGSKVTNFTSKKHYGPILNLEPPTWIQKSCAQI